MSAVLHVLLCKVPMQHIVTNADPFFPVTMVAVTTAEAKSKAERIILHASSAKEKVTPNVMQVAEADVLSVQADMLIAVVIMG